MLELYFGLMLWIYMLDLHVGFTYHDLASIRIQIITSFNNSKCLGDVAQGLLASLALARGAGTRARALVNHLNMRAATRVAARIYSAPRRASRRALSNALGCCDYGGFTACLFFLQNSGIKYLILRAP